MQQEGSTFKELYALNSDRNELMNQAANSSYACDVNYLGQMIGILKACVGPTCWAK